jgi:hypothetical protein
VARQLGQPLQRGMAGREIVRARGENHDHPLGHEIPGKEGHEVAARAVDPVDVLEDQYRRRHPPHPVQQADDALVQAARGDRGLRRQRRIDRLRGDQLRHDPREVAARRPQQPVQLGPVDAPGEAAEGLHEGQVREPVAEVEAAADHGAAAPGPDACGQLCHEPGLADPCLATDHQDRRTPGRGFPERAIELGEVRVASDEHRARDTPHPADGTTAERARERSSEEEGARAGQTWAARRGRRCTSFVPPARSSPSR